MKRFYCTICKRVKRVRKYPLLTRNIDHTDVRSREGICAWHDAQTGAKTRQSLSHAIQTNTPVVVIKSTKAVSAKAAR